MLKYKIKYKNFLEEEVEKTIYFNLSRTELTRMAVDDVAERMGKAAREDDKKTMFDIIETFILNGYGEISGDGENFDKETKDGHRLADRFKHSRAYDAIMSELTDDAEKAANFINGLVPKEVSEAVKNEDLKRKTADKMGINTPSGITTLGRGSEGTSNA